MNKIVKTKLQTLFDLMVKHGYRPTNKEFLEIVNCRNVKRDNPLDDFLRERTVKKHPAIDNLPLTKFMKRAMIVLPKECEEIIRAYDDIPKSKFGYFDVIDDKVSVIEKKSGKYSAKEEAAIKAANKVLEDLKSFQNKFGFNLFSVGLIKGFEGGKVTANTNLNIRAIAESVINP